MEGVAATLMCCTKSRLYSTLRKRNSKGKGHMYAGLSWSAPKIAKKELPYKAKTPRTEISDCNNFLTLFVIMSRSHPPKFSRESQTRKNHEDITGIQVNTDYFVSSHPHHIDRKIVKEKKSQAREFPEREKKSN